MQGKQFSQASHRVHWIDICRGIGIILVLYGHLFVSDKNTYLIFAFHMPLFFFISGLVFKPTKKSLWETTTKYFKQLLIPYYIFCCPDICFYSYFPNSWRYQSWRNWISVVRYPLRQR